MDLHLGNRHWEMHAPHWSAALVAGFLAGALLMILELLWAISGGNDPWLVAHKVAGITLGQSIVNTAEFSIGIIATALMTHYVLGMLYGGVLAAILSGLGLDESPGMAFGIGAAFGIVLYVFNFYVMTNAYPWFVEMRTLATFIGHVIFGMMLGILYWRMRRHQT